MSTQPGQIIWGQRLGAAKDESTASDLQQVIARVTTILSHRRWLFTFSLLTGTLAALVVSLFMPRQYNLTALFERRDDVVITKLVSNSSPYSFETLRRSLSIDLAGYNALLETADQLGLTGLAPGMDPSQLAPEAKARRQAVAASLSRQVFVGLMEKSTFLDLIEVRYVGDDPDMGVRLVTSLKDNYITRTRQRIADILAKSYDFFRQEANKRKERVAKMEAELLQTAVQHPGVDPADPGVLDQRIMAATTSLEDLARRKVEATTKLDATREYLAQLEAATAGRMVTSAPAMPGKRLVMNPRRQRLAADIEKVTTEIDDAKALRKMTDHHPSVVALREKLAHLRSQYEKEPEGTYEEERLVAANAPTISTATEAEHRRSQMESRTLQDLLAQIDRDVKKLNTDKTRLEEEKGKLFERRQTFLLRQQELQSAKSDLNIWESHVETISRVLTAEAESRGIQFATMEEARRPAKPASPTLMGVFLLSAAIGLALGGAAVFLREVFDRSFRTAERVKEALGIPVLEVIGEIAAGAPKRWFSRRYILTAIACAQVAVVLAAGALVYVSIEKPLLYERVLSQASEVLHSPNGRSEA